MRKIFKNKNGSMHILVIFIIIFMLGGTMIGIEFFRIQSINQHLNDELYRAVNLSIKTAMHDSWRQDHISKFDEGIAENAFYEYLNGDLQLDSNLAKYEGGEEVYSININEMSIDGENVRMNVKANVTVNTLFNLWGEKWSVPIDVTSRNMRVD